MTYLAALKLAQSGAKIRESSRWITWAAILNGTLHFIIPEDVAKTCYGTKCDPTLAERNSREWQVCAGN